jgi:hypothetical protein
MDDNAAGDLDMTEELPFRDESLEKRMQILDRIDSGQISADEGLRLLSELEPEQSAETETTPLPLSEAPALPGAEPYEPGSAANNWDPPSEPAGQTSAETAQAVTGDLYRQPEVLPGQHPFNSEDFARWHRYWMIPLWVGVGITVFGGLLMYWAMESAGFGFWFLCAAVPFAIGVLCMVIAAQSRTAHWLHLRVRQRPGERPQNIAISFPIPIGLTAWFFRTFRHRIPGLENVPQDIDQLILAVRDGTSPETPLYIEVDEGDGERVEIYIG